MEDELSKCFLCHIKFEGRDTVTEFFGGYTHWSCFDKQMKENEERDKNAN